MHEYYASWFVGILRCFEKRLYPVAFSVDNHEVRFISKDVSVSVLSASSGRFKNKFCQGLGACQANVSQRVLRSI